MFRITTHRKSFVTIYRIMLHMATKRKFKRRISSHIEISSYKILR
jgi:hypothetical protein